VAFSQKLLHFKELLPIHWGVGISISKNIVKNNNGLICTLYYDIYQFHRENIRFFPIVYKYGTLLIKIIYCIRTKGLFSQTFFSVHRKYWAPLKVRDQPFEEVEERGSKTGNKDENRK
jgi:hypothetical protein